MDPNHITLNDLIPKKVKNFYKIKDIPHSSTRVLRLFVHSIIHSYPYILISARHIKMRNLESQEELLGIYVWGSLKSYKSYLVFCSKGQPAKIDYLKIDNTLYKSFSVNCRDFCFVSVDMIQPTEKELQKVPASEIWEVEVLE